MRLDKLYRTIPGLLGFNNSKQSYSFAVSWGVCVYLKPTSKKSKNRGIVIDNNDLVDNNKNKDTLHISQSKAEISKPIGKQISEDIIGEIKSVKKYTDVETSHPSPSTSHSARPSSSKTSSKKYSKSQQKGKKLAAIHEGCIYYKQGKYNENLEKHLEWEIHSLKTLIGHMYEKHGIDEGAKIFLNDILQPEELKEFIENICQAINYAENQNHLIQLLDGFMSENEKMTEKEKKKGKNQKN
uniref:Uncharacterized protein n=1 Tax=Meloidogyne enterolobii TaxID=390850 RepID=A0A6V7XU58_MELEN|nr:unnamed protein product [Meloidogyne enterolobii]